MQWGAFKDRLRRSVLNDERGTRWSDDQLMDFCHWALDAFCTHTAAYTSVEVAVASGDILEGSFVIDLPENIFTMPDEAGALYQKMGYDRVFFSPIAAEHPAPQSHQFWVLGNQLVFNENPSTLTLEYYAYYNHPYADTDELSVPRWALMPLSYLIASFAMSGEAPKTANIRQYVSSEDRGGPEDNPFEVMAAFYLRRYEHEISRFPPQQRKLHVGHDAWRRSVY